MFERGFLRHLILLSGVIWSVQCGEKPCVCKICPQFNTPGQHCECCVWHLYGKRDFSDAGNAGDAAIKTGSLPSAMTPAAAVDSDDDISYFEDIPCRPNVYSNPDNRIRIGASLNTVKLRLKCLLWLTRDPQRKFNLFYP